MSDYSRIPQIYLSDMTKMMEALNSVDSASSHLWLTGDIRVTDGDVIYTLVYQDDAWWLDTEQTTTKE